MKFSSSIKALVLFIVVSGLAILGLKPQLSYDSMMFTVVLGMIAIGFFGVLSEENSDDKNGAILFLFFAVACFSTMLLISFYGATASLVENTAARYAGLIGEVDEKGSQLPTLSLEKPALVTYEIAHNRAMKKLSEKEVAALGSQYTVGEMKRQLVNGEVRWVGFLEPRGFSRWFFENGAPGYVSVSANDESDAKLVTKLDGKPIEINYGPEHWFHQEINGSLWYRNPFQLLDSVMPQIDDQGRPYWVAPVLDRTVARDGLTVKAVVVKDAQTGETKEYSMENLPSWVEVVYSRDLVESLVNFYGEYSKGARNFSGEGKMEVEESDLVFVDGKAQYLLSIGAKGRNSTGIFGYFIVNARTGKASYYSHSAVEENEASKAILGALPMTNRSYKVSDPRPHMVEGVPTYVAVAYTDSGANKYYGIADMATPQNVAVGTTLQAAYQNFLALAKKPGSVKVNEEVEIKERTLTVARIAQVGDIFHVLFVEDSLIYVADPKLHLELGLTQPKDKVIIRASVGERQGTILEFDNKEF